MFVAASALYIYSPVIGTHADSSQEADINLTVGESISLVMDKTNLGLDATVGSFVKGTVNATVSTNSQYGYSLTLEDKDSSTDMTSTTPGVTDVVSSTFSGSKDSSSMDDNNWGYSLDSTAFYKIPVYGSPVTLKSTNTVMTTENETTAVDFGIKVGMNLTAGTYEDVVVFSAYTNGQDSPRMTMQDFSCTLLENEGDKMILKDARDGNLYTVAKLKDGTCWMTDNLRLVGELTLTSEDTDMPEGVEFTLPGAVDWWPEDYYIPKVAMGEVGAFYNYNAASAGTVVQQKNNELPYIERYSICPKNWTMPTTAQFASMSSSYVAPNATTEEAVQAMKGEPLNFRYFGMHSHYSDQMHWIGQAGQDIEGGWWSSTIILNTNKGVGSFGISDRNGISIGNTGGDRNQGLYIRCIYSGDKPETPQEPEVDDNEPKIEGTMQDFTCDTEIPIGQAGTLTDVRDGTEYGVAKLKDGKCWMTKNLRIMNKELDSTTSDLPEGETWTVPDSGSEIVGFARNVYDKNDVFFDNTYGGYYSFYAATAGWGTYAMRARGLYSPKSICPKGWRLPYGGDDYNTHEFYQLIQAYSNSITEMMSSNAHWEYGGYIMNNVNYRPNGWFKSYGTEGAYWTAHVNGTSAYTFTISNASVGIPGDPSKYQGLSVRCVAR